MYPRDARCDSSARISDERRLRSRPRVNGTMQNVQNWSQPSMTVTYAWNAESREIRRNW